MEALACRVAARGNKEGGSVTTLRPHRNNFDFLRCMAAIMVIYGHGWSLSGAGASGLWGVPFARVGLDVFFSISGYLVTGSWERAPRLGRFLANRSLRIFPGLIACIVLTALVLGPLVTVLPTADYLRDGRTWGFLRNIALYQQLRLPGVFEHLHEPGAVNGSLWSLLPEFLCYLTVPALSLLPRRGRLSALAVGGFGCGALGLWLFEGYGGQPFVFYGADVKYMLVQVPFFFVGGAFRLLESRGDGFYRADLALLCFTLNYGVSSWLDWGCIPLQWLTTPYMVITFGRLSAPLLRDVSRWGDCSYGLYLYAFPMQQLILERWPGNPYPIWTCVALTAPLAFLSWHLVEGPALRLKFSARGGAAPRRPRRVRFTVQEAGEPSSAAATAPPTPGSASPRPSPSS